MYIILIETNVSIKAKKDKFGQRKMLNIKQTNRRIKKLDEEERVFKRKKQYFIRSKAYLYKVESI